MDWQAIGLQLIYGSTTGVAYVVFALGLTLVLGVMGIINVAHGELYMLGAMLYCSAIYYVGLNFFLAALVVIVLVCALGAICSRVAVEPLLNSQNPLLTTMLSTLAISMSFMYGGLLVWGAKTVPADLPFTDQLRLGALYVPEGRLVLTVVGSVTILLLYLFVEKTEWGKVIRATAQNKLAASLMGINLRKVYGLSFTIAAGLAALAGILVAPIWTANPFMGQFMILKGFVVVIVAGLGNIRGAIVVGLLLGIAETFFGHFVSIYYREGLGYAIMVITLLLKPKGLFER
jgi:branched-chain amino acid transport system permease protein